MVLCRTWTFTVDGLDGPFHRKNKKTLTEGICNAIKDDWRMCPAMSCDSSIKPVRSVCLRKREHGTETIMTIYCSPLGSMPSHFVTNGLKKFLQTSGFNYRKVSKILLHVFLLS